MKNPLIHLFLIFISFSATTTAQNFDYSILSIPENLKENANACIRLYNVETNITSRKLMTTKKTRIVTVFNEFGMRHIGAVEYDKVKSAEAILYNSFGKEIKKFKKKDFKEVSVSEGAIITDNKTFYLEFTPTDYPFTIVYTSETETGNTAFIRPWYAINDVFVSTEKSSLKITYPTDLGFKFKEYNFGAFPIKNETTANSISYSVENLPAVRNEDYSPSINNYTAYVLFGLDYFNLEGVEGTAKTWKEFGTWMNTNLLNGTDEISLETQNKIKALVGQEKDPLKISKIVYEYVQGKTRYVSIQLGIGGWRPMLAKDVDRLGYGDCKALSNYTRSLLQVVGVPSYYTVVYGGDKRDINSDFVSLQGNHVILAIPVQDKLYWLECTSQVNPFAFQGKFTDNRNVLIITPEGGKIVKTSQFISKDNTQISKGVYSLSESGSLSGTIIIKSKGSQYDDRFLYDRKSNDDLKKHYKEYFGNINNLKLNNIKLTNNKDDIEFMQDITLEADQYGSFTGGRLMFAINAFNQFRHVPKRYKVRNNPFEIERGFQDNDEVTITIPDGFSIEAKPENFELKDIYGHYKAEYEVLDSKHILYKRSFLLNEGIYPSADYEKYRKFSEQISRNDNAKFVLVKS